MNLKIYVSILLLFVTALAGCSSSDIARSSDAEGMKTQLEDQNPSEYIVLDINEAIHFEFSKYDSTWTGDLKIFTLNEKGEKVVKSAYTSAKDSSWNDFDLFVDFLHLYEIPPQNQIEGWVPDNDQLPMRVYSFEVFDGDATRSFSYQDPERDLQNYWQAQNLVTFVTFVQNDLRWLAEKESE